MDPRVWLLLLCLLPACSPGPARAPIGDRSERPAHIPAFHRVGQGDTLYSIAFQYGLTVERLAAWNGIRPPYTIYRGQKLRLTAPPASRPRTPVVRVPAPSRPKVSVAPPAKPAPAHASRPAAPKTATRPAPKAADKPSAARGPLRWAWPAEGRVIRRFNARSSGKKGIDIAGRAGSTVRAAADGKVVYAGSGLGGYGRLIIIKHNKDFLSAYAHNRKLIAREGQWVRKGDPIALMGSSATDRTKLHFEIRRKGRPVDPLRYLPAR